MTTTPATALRGALASLKAPAASSCDELLRALTALGEAQAVLDAAKLGVVGEIVERSALPEPSNPVSRAGHARPATLVAERWGVPVPAARAFCEVGAAIRSRTGLTGETLPARFPALAAAFEGVLAGDPVIFGDSAPLSDSAPLTVDQAVVIVRELTKAAPACALDDVLHGERLLVEHAPTLTIPELRTVAGQVRDRLDQDGVLPRERRQRQRRSLTISTTSDGLTHVDWYLDPESAAYVVTAIDAFVGHELRTVRFRDSAATPEGVDEYAAPEGGDEYAAPAETRSLPQLRSDAATDIFRHVAGCSARTAPDAVGTTPPVTVIVRIALADLQAGVGLGEIDGIATPVSAGTVRRMAADARMIPAVLGGPSEVLDLGRGRRLFSTAQKLALAERDGGCAWMGCPHPPSYTEAHHLEWWSAHGGRTDLDNGILLCSTHHHRVHDDGWQIQVRESVPYFIPPDAVDPYRRPRRGGRVRLPDAA